MGDFHELKLGFRRVWSPVDSSSSSVGYYGSGTSVGNQGTHSGARAAARPIPYRTGGAGTGSGASTGMAFSPATLLGTSPSMSMSPSRNNNIMLHSSGFSAVPNTGANATGGENSGCESAVEVGPGVRFCHVGVVYEGAFYIFGGYDGTQR